MGFMSFIYRVLGLGKRWNGTPEQYLAMVQYMARKNNPEYDLSEFLHWGEVMQKVMKVNLTPYRDFRDLLARGMANYTMVEKVHGKIAELEQRRELKRAIYGKNIDLGDDDVMKSQSEGAVFAREMIKDLSKHVRFSDEEQRKIDNF